MDATLTISGPFPILVQAAQHLDQTFAELVVSVEAGGWTPPRAKLLCDALHWKARLAIEEAVKNEGFVTDNVLRRIIGDSLKGSITGPISKHLKRLVSEGKLPEGISHPLVSDYDRGFPHRQRTGGMRMPTALIPIFAEALDL